MRRVLCGLLLVGLSSLAQAAPRIINGARFSFPLPEGYEDITSGLSESQRGRQMVVVIAEATTAGTQPTIVFQKAPVPARIQDPAGCKRTGEQLASGVKGKLLRSAIVAGPVGKACQMELVGMPGVAFITELDVPGETWLMTCNHAEGDAAADKVCKATLAAVKVVKK